MTLRRHGPSRPDLLAPSLRHRSRAGRMTRSSPAAGASLGSQISVADHPYGLILRCRTPVWHRAEPNGSAIRGASLLSLTWLTDADDRLTAASHYVVSGVAGSWKCHTIAAGLSR